MFEPQSLSSHIPLLQVGGNSVSGLPAGSGLNEAVCKAREEKFFELLGEQIMAMQRVIDERLELV